jgi:hypothetical protein
MTLAAGRHAAVHVCGSLCHGGQLQLLGLDVVAGDMETSFVGFGGVIVVGEGGEAGTLVVELARMVARVAVVLSHLSSSLDSTVLEAPGLSPDTMLGVVAARDYGGMVQDRGGARWWWLVAGSRSEY